jgi:hypothetical protein
MLTLMKYIINKIGEWFIQVYPVSMEWDSKLNVLMDNHTFNYINQYTARLGDHIIWISSHSYASFSDYTHGDSKLLPAFSTVMRAIDKLNYDCPKKTIRENRVKSLVSN